MRVTVVTTMIQGRRVLSGGVLKLLIIGKPSYHIIYRYLKTNKLNKYVCTKIILSLQISAISR